MVLTVPGVFLAERALFRLSLVWTLPAVEGCGCMSHPGAGLGAFSLGCCSVSKVSGMHNSGFKKNISGLNLIYTLKVCRLSLSCPFAWSLLESVLYTKFYPHNINKLHFRTYITYIKLHLYWSGVDNRHSIYNQCDQNLHTGISIFFFTYKYESNLLPT